MLLRAGFLADPSTLLYFTGGYAGHIVNTNGTVAVPGGTASFSTNNTMNGWTFGPGFETMLTNKLSAKLEYRYSQFGRQTIGSTGISMEPSTRAIRAGLSYRFGGLGVVSSDQSFAGSFNWTGVYLGGAVGGGLGFAQTSTAGPASTSFNSGSRGLLGGFFGGGDWQFSPQALVGVMAGLHVPGHHRRHQSHDARWRRLCHGGTEPPVERDGPPGLAGGAVEVALCGGRLQRAQCAAVGRCVARRRHGVRPARHELQRLYGRAGVSRRR